MGLLSAPGGLRIARARREKTYRIRRCPSSFAEHGRCGELEITADASGSAFPCACDGGGGFVDAARVVEMMSRLQGGTVRPE
jgi:hypothetical protein